MPRAEFTISVPADVLAEGDWREDPRWDELTEWVIDRFGGDWMAWGVLRDDEAEPRTGREAA